MNPPLGGGFFFLGGGGGGLVSLKIPEPSRSRIPGSALGN